MIQYFPAADVREKVIHLIEALNMHHVNIDRITCIRSSGTSSRHIIARCHALPRIMQQALQTRAHYVIEVVSEKYDGLGEEDKIKTLIHELMHIPKNFGGGFRHHDFVCSRNVERLYKIYKDH